MLNPDLDIDALRAAWRVDQRVRIDGVLEEASVQAVHAALADLPWELAFFLEDGNRVVSREQMAQLSAQQKEELQANLITLAARGMGFMYSAYRMDDAHRGAAPAVLGSLFETVNRELLDLVRRVTGVDEIASADGQFTRYEPGHYLTRHSDSIGAEGRRLAYVLGLTPSWHPDWGGLLQFFEDEGEPRDAWVPRFNSLALFDVRHVHSVTFVTPFAPAPRLSLTGWFRQPVGI